MVENDNSTGHHCAHCGDPCGETTIVADELRFCCSGCQTVYAILRENGLANFYQLDATAGRSQRKHRKEDYAWLDEEVLVKPLLRYEDDQRGRIRLELPQIHCISCVWLLENLGKIHPGVISVQVNFGRRRADILFAKAAISVRALAELLARIGYPPLFERDDNLSNKTTNRRLLYQIGLAGFTFGNVMLLSFPEYLGLHIDLAGSSFARFFGYLNLGLSIPLMLYSGRDYLTAAARGLFRRQLTIDVPIALGLLALFFRSAYEVLSHTGAGYFDSLAGLLFFLLVGRWFQDRTFDRLAFDRDYRHYFPVAARRRKADGTTEAIGIEAIGEGDHILIRPGDLIPADGTLENTTSSGIDYSFVTGETLPQSRRTGDAVYAGGRATQDGLEITVTKAVDQSYLLQLWREDAGERATRNRNSTDRISRYFTAIVLFIATATLLYWWSTGVNFALRAATSVLIIACPCALALAIPFTYGTLMRVLAKRGLYLKGVDAVEKVGRVDTLVLDKTGTLTESTATFFSATDEGLSEAEESVVLAMVDQSSHPMSRYLAQYLRLKGREAVSISPIREEGGKGIELKYEGRIYRVGSAAFCGQPTQERSPLFVCVDGRPMSRYFPAPPQLRKGVDQMIRRLSGERELHLLSGDQDRQRDYWRAYLPDERLRFEQSPFDKQRYVGALRETGKSVMMVGDGLNDAGALRRADVGVAVSEDMANFSPACDGILLAEKVGRLPELMGLVTRGKYVLYLAYLLAFCYNLIGLSFAVRGLLSPVVAAILMPLSSLTIVAVGVGFTYLLDHFTPSDEGAI